MATRVTFDLPFAILQRELDDVVTLSEEELAGGVRLALRATHNLAEGAGAAPLAAAMKLRDQPGRQDGRLRDERRQHRRRHAQARARYCVSVKFTVTVITIGTGVPFSSVGENFHRRTAASAASSSSGIDRRSCVSVTLPCSSMVASMITMPSLCATRAVSGYTGAT